MGTANNGAPSGVMQLDIDQILKEKLPDRKIPGFLVRYLKRIVHQDEMNRFFLDQPDAKNVEFIRAAVDFLDATAEFIGVENLPPADGRYIFVSNHPLGGLDSLFLGAMLGEKYEGNVKYFANDILMFLEPMNEMFLPVNKGGQGAVDRRETLRVIDEFFKSDFHLITFPSGAGSRKIKGKIQDKPWIKTFVSKAVEYERDVVPIYFEGRNSNFFYNLSNIRTKLGLPNIEMLYLVHEMFKQRGNHFRVKVGEKIPHTTFDKSKRPQEWAAWVRSKVYEMED